MEKCESSLLFLGKAADPHSERALRFCRQHFAAVQAHLGTWGDPLPESLEPWQGDFIISYLSRWVIPARVLAKAGRAAINFHPAPPEYPGIGCTNFALYEEAKEFGVTCHHMDARVDTGAIIAVRRFPVHPSDSVATLLARSQDQQLVLFYEIMDGILAGQDLPATQARWTRKPFTRKEVDQLGQITLDMGREEIARRIRAATFGPWKPTLELQGFTFELKTDPMTGS